MRVAFVSARTSHHEGTDAERTARVEGLAGRLAARGHDVTLFCRRWWGGGADEFEADGLRYRAVPTDPGGRFAVRLPGRLRAFDPDVVHAAHDDPANVLGASLASAPLVVDYYEPLPDADHAGLRGALEPRLRRWAVTRPDRLVTPSRTVKTGVRAQGAGEDSVVVLPTGIDFDLVRETDPVGDADVVYSRRLDADANLESLLLALAEFRQRGWTATVIGDGPERASYEQQAADLRIDDRVDFAGALPEAERVGRFKAAHAYVHTAKRTAFPTDLLRAFACGCVGIVEYHAESSAHELAERRERGSLATSESELVAALEDAGDLEHRTVDESFAEFDHDTVLRRYLDLYRDVQGLR